MISAKPTDISIPAKVNITIDNINPAASSITNDVRIKPRFTAKNITSKLISIDIKFFLQMNNPIIPKTKMLVGKIIVNKCNNSIK